MRELSLWKIKKVLQLLILFKKFYLSLIASKAKYGWIKGVNYTIDQWNHGRKTIIQICIQHITNIWLQYEKMCISSLANEVGKYNNIYHSPINMKPADVKSSTNIVSNKENKKGDPKFGVNDHVEISKYENIFAKVFVSERVKNNVRLTYVISNINGEEIAGKFYEKELQK